MWRYNEYRPSNSQDLADSLSVEGLDESKLPTQLVEAVREFRKLRQDTRTAACKRFIEENA